MLIKTSFLSILNICACTLLVTGCLRFSEEKSSQPTSPTLPKISLKTLVAATGNPLKPYKVAVSVHAPRYDGLILVKATEQIVIGKPSTFGAQSVGKQAIAYNQLKALDSSQFTYDDTNVNPKDVFWYAVIKSDGGSSGIIQEQGELPQPLRVELPEATVNATVTMTSTVEQSGLGLKPYVVKIEGTAPLATDSNLKLVRAASLNALAASNYTVVAQISVSPFSITDNTLYPTDTGIYAVINGNSAQAYVLPAPLSITLPALANNFSSIALTQVTAVGQLPKSKLSFAPVYGKQRLRKSINGVELTAIDLALDQTEYVDENLDFDKNYSYKLEQLDHYDNAAGLSQSLTVNFPWPVIDFSTEFSAVVNPKSALHQYETRVQDLSTIKRILQIKISGDGANFTTAQTITDLTSSRAFVQDFSAPAVRYYKIVQVDRNSNELATSPIYTLTIPTDKEFTGTNYLNQDWIGLGRIKLTSGAILYTQQTNFTISGDRLISEDGVIRAFALGTQAVNDSTGRTAGNISLNLKSATGNLTIDSRGERGGNGSNGVNGNIGSSGMPGSIGVMGSYGCQSNGIWFPYWTNSVMAGVGGAGGPGGRGSDGQPGNPGKSGGDSGKITLIVSNDISGFAPTLMSAASSGGTGGLGGLAGPAGPGGAGGRGGLNCVTSTEWGQYCPMTQMNDNTTWWCQDGGANNVLTNTTSIPDSRRYAAKGADGSPGQPGNAGVPAGNGSAGSPNQTCTKYPNATIQTCI